MADDIRFSPEPPPKRNFVLPPELRPTSSSSSSSSPPGEPPFVDAEVVNAAPATPWTIDTRRYVSPHQAALANAARPERRRWPWIVALAIGIPLAGIALFALLGWLFIASAKELAVEEKDRAVVLTAEHIAPYYRGFRLRPSAASIKKLRYLDGSHDVEYEYESPASEAMPLNVSCTVSVEKNPSEAATSYAAMSVGEDIGMSVVGNIKVVARNDLFRWGDESTLAVVHNEHGPVGNLFRARSGRYVFSVSFFGIYFDQAAPLAELLTPVLDRMTKYSP